MTNHSLDKAFLTAQTWGLLVVLLFTTRPSLGQPSPDSDPRVAKAVASVSESRLRQLVQQLAAFGTRHTLSNSTSSTSGIGAARQWIFDELKRTSPKLQVSFDTYRLAPQGRILQEVELRNVIAVLPGRSARRIYVTAHYDSVAAGGVAASVTRPVGQTAVDQQMRADQDFNAPAAGANDNASGTALTMEVARVLADSGIEFDATLVFALWAGEEQASLGAHVHADRLAADKTIVVDAMFNSDIVGNSRGGNGIIDAEGVRVFSEGPEDSMSRAIARYVQGRGAVYLPSHRVRLMARADRFSRGSDHMAFNQLGFAGVVFREANEDFGRQHVQTDLLDGMDFTYLAQNTRLALASVASLAVAPPAPRVTDAQGAPTIGRQPSGYDANLGWAASPAAVAYRIYWRDTWSQDWQHSQVVGNITSFVLPNVSIDDFVFGVSAVGPSGSESLISPYVAVARRLPDVKMVP